MVPSLSASIRANIMRNIIGGPIAPHHMSSHHAAPHHTALPHRARVFLAHGMGLHLLLIWLRCHSVLCNRTDSAIRENESRYRESQNARVHFEPPQKTYTPGPLTPHE